MTALALWLFSLVPAVTGFLLAFRWLSHLPDGGWAFSRVIAIVLWGFAVALPWSAGVWSLSRPVALFAALALVALAAARGVREHEAIGRFLAARRACVLSAEAVFVGSVAVFAVLAAQYPDVHPGGHERFQDFAIVQAVARSGGFPVEDPWFAGEPLAYYFFGHALVALVQVAGALDPFRFFNLALVAVHALFAAAAFGLGLATTGRRRFGAATAFLVVFCGSLWPLTRSAWETAWRPIDWFGAARAIEGAVTEFPAFVILYADLHAHVIALPVFVTALALAWAWLDRAAGAADLRGFLGSWPLLVLGGVVSGALLAVNPLDGATALALFAAVAAARSLRPGVAPGAAATGLPAAVLLVSVPAVLVSSPFLAATLGTSRRLRWVEEGSTGLELLTHFGLLLGLLAAGAAGVAWALRREAPLRSGAALAALGLAAALLARPAGSFVALLAATAALALAARGDARPATPWAAAVAFVAVALVLSCELFYVEAWYGPSDLGRQVSTSKLYLQAWVMLGAAAVPLLARLAASGSALPAFALSAALVLGGQYPVLAALSRTYFFHGAWSLHATGIVERERPGDWKAVRWLREKPGRAVVLEAPGDPYTWAGRIATLSGGVAPLAWGYHEASWRNSWDVVREREALVHAIYSGTLGEDDAEAALDRLGVEYLVVGALERDRYPAEALGRLTAGREKVFEADGTALYRRAAR